MSVAQDLNIKEIFVALLNEEIDVWKPVKAEYLGGNRYKLCQIYDYDPNIEQWEFSPGTIVECEIKKVQDGEILAAVRMAA